MYFTASFILLGVYYKRHNPSDHPLVIYTLFAFFILWNSVATITSEPIWFWSLTWIAHFFASTFLIFTIYGTNFKPRNYLYNLIDLFSSIAHCRWNTQVISMTTVLAINWTVLLLLGNLKPVPFSEALLFTILLNTICYYTYYVQLKRINGEHRPIVNILLNYAGVIILILGLVSFTHGVTDKTKSPELNRQQNQNCIVLNFFDYHDLWHFATSYGLGFLFLGLQFIDEDLIGVKRTDIKVF